MSVDDTTQDGRMWAAISYAGTFIGIPLGIVPLAQRNDAFALAHAKAAVGMQLTYLGLTFASFAVAMVLFFCTFGLSNFVFIPVFMLMMLWPIASSIHGIILATSGDWTPAAGTFGIGDRIFEKITLEQSEQIDD